MHENNFFSSEKMLNNFKQLFYQIVLFHITNSLTLKCKFQIVNTNLLKGVNVIIFV